MASQHSEYPCLEPQHKIFLSHSGAQKDFTHQLCVDLERVNHFPFFDKRPHSLPKGEQFPQLILQAARQCKVAVVILSKEFVESKWPMVELIAFTKQSEEKNTIRILPLFYRLSIKDCSDEKQVAEWWEIWEKWAASDSHGFNAQDCKMALKNLSNWNGELFDVNKGGEVEYRRRIVSSICKLIPSDYWDDVGVQGRDKLCRVLEERFLGAQPLYSSPDALVVGLHGFGGVGKTTICRCMCRALYGEFSGKVWHMELPTKPSRDDVLKQLLLVLKKLTEADDDFVNSISTIQQAGEQLKKRMRSISSTKVFLAIDNVWDDELSMEGARTVLNAGFKTGSKVLVTARSRTVLEKLLGQSHCCMAAPTTGEDDAVAILLNQAAPGCTVSELSDHERDVIDDIVQHCHYHALALKTFGGILSRLGREISVWQEKLETLRKDPLQDDNPVVSLIRASYSDLSDELKLFILDLVVLMPIANGYQIISREEATKWLDIVHPDSRSISDMLTDLRKYALLDWGNVDEIIQIPDLLRDYVWEVSKSGRESRCLYLDYFDNVSAELSEQDRGKLERIAITNSGLGKLKLEGCFAVKFLYVGDCSDLKKMRLRGMLSLRSLEIVRCYNLVKLEGLSSLKRLCRLRVECCRPLFESCVSWLKLNRDIARMTGMQVLEIKRTGLKRAPSLSKCRRLREVHVVGNLRLTEFPKLGQLTMLETLRVSRNGRMKISAPDLGSLSNLQRLHLEGNYDNLALVDLPSFDMWPQLRSLYIGRCCFVSGFPDMGSLTKLQELEVYGCKEKASGGGGAWGAWRLRVAEVEKMIELRSLDVLGDFEIVLETPFISKFPSSLQRLNLGMASCITLDILPSLANLVNLEILTVVNCRAITEIRDLSSFPRLATVDLSSCSNLTKVCGSSNTLKRLKLQNCTMLEAIPDLRHLPRLEDLDLDGCERLSGVVLDLPRLRTLDYLGIRGVCSVETLIHYLVVAAADATSHGSQALFMAALRELNIQILELQEKKKVALLNEMAASADVIITKALGLLHGKEYWPIFETVATAKSIGYT